MADAPLITSEEFDTLEAEWAALWATVGDATPFQHPAWYRVWLRHFGSGTSPVFLSIRRGEHLVGVAALDMDREEARQLGDHNVQDYAGPLWLPGEEGPVAAGILEWLREDLTPGAVFWGLAKDSPMRDALAEAAEAGGWESSESHEAVCPGVDLPGNFEAFVGGLSKHDRHELRRKMRNFEAAGAVGRFTVAKGADYKQCTLGLVEIMFSQFGKRAHMYRQTGCLQLTGTLSGKLLGKAALTGKAHQPALPLGGGR